MKNGPVWQPVPKYTSAVFGSRGRGSGRWVERVTGAGRDADRDLGKRGGVRYGVIGGEEEKAEALESSLHLFRTPITGQYGR